MIRQHHLAGEKLFVDFSGTTLPIVDRRTGEINKAEIFVAVMGASNYTFVMACYRRVKIDHWEVRRKTWTGLNRYAKTQSVLGRTE